MTWSRRELEAFEAMRQFYLKWIADIEAGKETVTYRILGNVVDDRQETLDRYRRNAAELKAILDANGTLSA